MNKGILPTTLPSLGLVIFLTIFGSSFSMAEAQEAENFFCNTLKTILADSPSGFENVRGKKDYEDEYTIYWIGQEVFGAINSCEVTFEKEEKEYGYNCSSGRDSDEEMIKDWFNFMVQSCHQCIENLKGKWVLRKNERKGKRFTRTSVEFQELIENRMVAVTLIEAKNKDGFKDYRTFIDIY